LGQESCLIAVGNFLLKDKKTRQQHVIWQTATVVTVPHYGATLILTMEMINTKLALPDYQLTLEAND